MGSYSPMQTLTCLLLCCFATGVLSSETAPNIQTIQSQVIHLLVGVMTDPKHALYIPDMGQVDNELCKTHSRFYRDNLLNLTTWALKMFDSSSKMPSGLLMGNIVDLGNYDECLDVQDVVNEAGKFSGQHCLVRVLPPGHTDAGYDPRLLRQSFSLSTLELVLSLCVPSTCRALDVNAHLQHVLPFLNLRVDEGTCNSRDVTISLTPLDWFAIALLLLLISVVIGSTSYDLICTQPGRRREILLVFSVYSNARTLFYSPAGKDSLSPVHGVRVLSMMWVVLGHRYMYAVLSTPTIDIFSHLNASYDWTHMFIANATLAVDSFLLLSGVLVCYVFLKEMQAGTPFNVPLIYLHRYLRLTPAFALVILLTVTLIPYLGDGPYWRFRTNVDREACVNGWWSALFYIDNYVHPNQVCLWHTWYLAVDTQLFWCSPLILYPLWKHPRTGKCLLGALLAVGLVIAFLVPYVNQFSALMIKLSPEATAKDYEATHTRFTPWLIGVALGYILHTTKSRQVYMSRAVVVIGWLLAVALLLIVYLLPHRFTQLDHSYERVFESLFLCLMRPAWALALAWIVFACVKGYGGLVNTILSWNGFLVLSRFTYTIFLVHFQAVSLNTASVKTAVYLNDFILVSQFIGDFALAFAAAIVLTLLVEAPIVALAKMALKSFHASRKTAEQNKFGEHSTSIEENGFENSNYSRENQLGLSSAVVQ